MCGLIYTTFPIEREKFLTALTRLKHRGPDFTSGLHQVGNSLMGHARLQILGLRDDSNQPFHHSALGISIVFNGEIYNYRQLADRYQIELSTGSDTELLVKLYRQLGVAMLPELDGMFAIAIYDHQSGQSFVVRDRLGVKPLFYWENNGEYVFSSEIRSILDIVGSCEIDSFAIRQYRALRGFFNGRTIYKHIKVFPPGHYMINGKLHCYWKLEQKYEMPPDDEELGALLCTAITSRMVSDVEVGALMSGGLDSTLIALVAKICKVWCAGLPGDADLDFANRVASDNGLNLHTVEMNPDVFLSIARSMIKQRAAPLLVPNEVALYLAACQIKSEGIKVILCGEGADELFGGYDRIFAWAEQADYFDPKIFFRLYGYSDHYDQEAVEEALSSHAEFKTPYLVVNSFFQQSHLAGLLARLDYSTMLAGVEAREPYVDFKLVERLFGMGFSKYKRANGCSKAPLKRIARGKVPDYIIDRPKIGFPMPLSSIFKVGASRTVAYQKWFDFNLRELGVPI
jgi:asparagine synthase (glutamine-hydrolysing)